MAQKKAAQKRVNSAKREVRRKMERVVEREDSLRDLLRHVSQKTSLKDWPDELRKTDKKQNDADNKKNEGNGGRKPVPPKTTTRDKNNNATARPNKKDQRQAQEEDVDPVPRADGNVSARSDRSASPRSRRETDKLGFSGRTNRRKKVNNCNEENPPGRSDQLDQEAPTQDIYVSQDEDQSRAPKRQHGINGEDRLDGGSDTDGENDHSGPETRQKRNKRAAKRARMERARVLNERNDEAGGAEDGNEYEGEGHPQEERAKEDEEESETDDEEQIMDRFRNHRPPRVRMSVIRDHIYPYSWWKDYDGVEVYGKINFFSKKKD